MDVPWHYKSYVIENVMMAHFNEVITCANPFIHGDNELIGSLLSPLPKMWIICTPLKMLWEAIALILILPSSASTTKCCFLPLLDTSYLLQCGINQTDRWAGAKRKFGPQERKKIRFLAECWKYAAEKSRSQSGLIILVGPCQGVQPTVKAPVSFCWTKVRQWILLCKHV